MLRIYTLLCLFTVLVVLVIMMVTGGVGNDDDGDENRLSVSWERAGRCQYFEKYVLRGHWDCCSASLLQCSASAPLQSQCSAL